MNNKKIVIIAGWVGGILLSKIMERLGYDIGKFNDDISRKNYMDSRVLNRFKQTFQRQDVERDEDWYAIKKFILNENKKVFRVRGVCQLIDFDEVLNEARNNGFEIKAFFISPRKLEIELVAFKDFMNDIGIEKDFNLDDVLSIKLHQESKILDKLNEMQIPTLRLWTDDFENTDFVVKVIKEFLNEDVDVNIVSNIYREEKMEYVKHIERAKTELSKVKKVESGCGGCP